MDLNKFAQLSDIIDGDPFEASHIVHTEVLADFIQLPKITIKTLNDVANRLYPNTTLRGEAEPVIYYGRTIDFSPKSLECLLKLLNDNDITSWTAYMKFCSLQPFTNKVNDKLGRMIWLWHEIKFGHVTWDENFAFKFHDQTMLWYIDREKAL